MRSVTCVAAACAAMFAAAGPALAADTCSLVIDDPAFDQTSTLNPTSALPTAFPASNSLDIRKAVFRYDPAAGANAASVRLTVTNLSRKIPAGSTSIVWTAQWTAANGTVYFVRAVNDLANNLVFEWGEQVPPVNLVVTSALPRYEYRGTTPGTFTEGPDGTIDIVIPQALAAGGAVLRDIYVQASEGRQVVPNAAATPTRGLSSPSDRAPSGTDLAGPWTVATCPTP